MAQATFSVRMDENLKRNFDTLCNEFGMNTSTAINIFARAVVRQRKIPFEITAPEKSVSREEGLRAFYALRKSADENNLQDMTLDEINSEIDAARRGDSE